MIKNVHTPAASISRISSFAPFTDLRCHAKKATKNETSDAHKKNREKIVNL
jgi:hypothetical protein